MKRGPPEKPIDLDQVKALAAQGLSEKQIALCLEIGYRTLQARKKKYSEFREALNEGQAKGVAQVTNALFKKAKEGDVGAMVWYLKNRDRDGWKDTRHSENRNTTVDETESVEKTRQVLQEMGLNPDEFIQRTLQ